MSVKSQPSQGKGEENLHEWVRRLWWDLKKDLFKGHFTEVPVSAGGELYLQGPALGKKPVFQHQTLTDCPSDLQKLLESSAPPGHGL